MLVRREVVETTGLLSEKVLFYGEDSEWCWRIRKSGWRIGLCDQVRFQHQEGQSTLRTWGELERRRRMWRGIYDSCREARGTFYASTLLVINAIAFAIEAYHPLRPRQQRDHSRKLLEAHLWLLNERLHKDAADDERIILGRNDRASDI
jgi:GT2 family glycosyltransferase